jgi:uncharacterized protein DUF4286
MAYWCMVKVDFAEPAREAEFNEWYDKVHVPELLALPGFNKAWRMKVAPDSRSLGEPGQTYIAVYDIDSPAAFDQRTGRPSWDGKWGAYIRNWARTFYEVSPFPPG